MKIRFLYFLALIFPFQLLAQNKSLDFFIENALNNSPSLIENTNLHQYFQLQNDLITAQNKKPQVSLTADYVVAPFFASNGNAVEVTSYPSDKAIGYDVGITNGGTYSGQVNVLLPLFNTKIIQRLYEQNHVQQEISAYSRGQLVQDIKKNIIDQYIITFQFQQQKGYVQQIIDQLENRKPLVEALVKQGLLQQNDYLLLEIEQITRNNELKQLQLAFSNGVAILKNLAAIADTNKFVLNSPNINFTPPPNEYYFQQKFRLDSLNLVAQQNVFNTRYLPQVSAIGSTGINAVEAKNIPRNVGVSAGIHLSKPIFDGHQKQITEQQNKVLLSNLQVYRNNYALIQQNNIKNAREQHDQWKTTVELLGDQIKKQELLLEILKEKIISGRISVMDYINALQDYALSQRNKAAAETNLLLYINQYNYYNW